MTLISHYVLNITHIGLEVSDFALAVAPQLPFFDAAT